MSVSHPSAISSAYRLVYLSLAQPGLSQVRDRLCLEDKIELESKLTLLEMSFK